MNLPEIQSSSSSENREWFQEFQKISEIPRSDPSPDSTAIALMKPNKADCFYGTFLPHTLGLVAIWRILLFFTKDPMSWMLQQSTSVVPTAKHPTDYILSLIATNLLGFVTCVTINLHIVRHLAHHQCGGFEIYYETFFCSFWNRTSPITHHFINNFGCPLGSFFLPLLKLIKTTQQILSKDVFTRLQFNF